MTNVEQTIISQYGNSTTISALIHNMDEYIDPTADIDNFYSFIWDVSQAQGFGLDIWGRIVGISREIFTNPIYYLSDTAFRELVMLKALSNISASTAPSINQLLQNWMTGRGRCYVTDLGSMQIGYVFEFDLQPFEIEILAAGNLFLRPAGVGSTVIVIAYPTFGFREGGPMYTGFNQAPFRAES